MDDLLSACDTSSPLTRTSSDPNLNNHCQEARAGLEPWHGNPEASQTTFVEPGAGGPQQAIGEMAGPPYDIVKEIGIKPIPMEKKCKKAKWLSVKALQIAVKRREAKSKGEKERYKRLNAEFQRIALSEAEKSTEDSSLEPSGGI